MDKLPHSLLLQILNLLEDSEDVARCRVASKAFDTVFPFIPSIDIRCSLKWYNSSSSQSLNTVSVNLISRLENVQSVCIRFNNRGVQPKDDNVYLMDDGDFAMEWLPSVAGSLKSLSLCSLPIDSSQPKYRRNIVILKLRRAWLSSMHNLNPMPMLTNLTLESIELEDEHLNQFNKCFPNLQVLNLVRIQGLKDPNIHLLNLQTFCLSIWGDDIRNLTLITPNLTTLRIEAVISHHFRLGFKNLKTLWLYSMHTSFLLSYFPISKTVENLTLNSGNSGPTDIKLTLQSVFSRFPNVGSLCIKADAWLEIEDRLNPEDWEILDGSDGLKTFCAYLMLDDPSYTFSLVACVLDQCVSLSDVSLLIHNGVVGTVSEGFMINCMARWPNSKWRWGIWGRNVEDTWTQPMLI